MRQNLLLRDMVDENKPRERLKYFGAEALSEAELLAILLRTGGKSVSVLDQANKLLKKYGNLRNLLTASLNKIVKEPNMGIAKAAILKATVEISNRIYSNEVLKTPIINKPEKAYKLVKSKVFAAKKEKLYLISLDSRKKLISLDLICIGSVNEAIFPIREILLKALENNAVNIILAHNHPSNDVNPSHEDQLVTNILEKACDLVGLVLLDHIIVSDYNYHSVMHNSKKFLH